MSLPRMSWHIGDYKKDTGNLRAAGHGAYFLLCMHYWATGGLPDDDLELAAIACMSDREWKQHKPIIQRFFHDGWKHKRIDRELKEATEKYEARASAGKKGGNAKANGKQKPSNARPELEPSYGEARANGKQPITLTYSEAKASGAVAPKIDLEKQLFERGKAVLGEKAGGLISNLIKAEGSIELARAAIETAATKQNPREWIGAIVRGNRPAEVDPRI